MDDLQKEIRKTRRHAFEEITAMVEIYLLKR